MNISESVEKAVAFEEMSLAFYRKIGAPGSQRAYAAGLWKDAVSQKEKLTGLLKKLLLEAGALRMGASRINLVSSRDMDDALELVEGYLKKSGDPALTAEKKLEMVRTIVAFELSSIYGPVFKMFDLRLLKMDPSWPPAVSRHFYDLEGYFKKSKGPDLSQLLEGLAFLLKRAPEVKSFSEETLFQTMVKERKPLTLVLKDGNSFSGLLVAFDHFSLRCRKKEVKEGLPVIEQIFMKESIVSIRVDA